MVKQHTASLDAWASLCEWLNEQPSKCSYRGGPHGYLLTDSYRRQRQQLDVVFYSSGWGWRLRRNWAANLNAVRAKETQEAAFLSTTAPSGGQR